jgi:hypothetical protein
MSAPPPRRRRTMPSPSECSARTLVHTLFRKSRAARTAASAGSSGTAPSRPVPPSKVPLIDRSIYSRPLNCRTMGRSRNQRRSKQRAAKAAANAQTGAAASMTQNTTEDPSRAQVSEQASPSAGATAPLQHDNTNDTGPGSEAGANAQASAAASTTPNTTEDPSHAQVGEQEALSAGATPPLQHDNNSDADPGAEAAGQATPAGQSPAEPPIGPDRVGEDTDVIMEDAGEPDDSPEPPRAQLAADVGGAASSAAAVSGGQQQLDAQEIEPARPTGSSPNDADKSVGPRSTGDRPDSSRGNMANSGRSVTSNQASAGSGSTSSRKTGNGKGVSGSHRKRGARLIAQPGEGFCVICRTAMPRGSDAQTFCSDRCGSVAFSLGIIQRGETQVLGDHEFETVFDSPLKVKTGQLRTCIICKTRKCTQQGPSCSQNVCKDMVRRLNLKPG